MRDDSQKLLIFWERFLKSCCYNRVSIMSEFEIETITEYTARVRKAARAKKGTPIYNSSPAHAEVILTSLWASAQSHVNLLSQCLNGDVYNSDALIESAQKFLSRPGTTADILFENEPQETNRFYKAMRAQDNVTMRAIDPELHGFYDFSLMTADDESYRFAEDKFEMSAVAAFGDAVNAKQLNSVFGEIKELKPTS